MRADALSAYPWQSYTLTPAWCRVSVLNSDWINHPRRGVLRGRGNTMIRHLPDTRSHWLRVAVSPL